MQSCRMRALGYQDAEITTVEGLVHGSGWTSSRGHPSTAPGACRFEGIYQAITGNLFGARVSEDSKRRREGHRLEMSSEEGLNLLMDPFWPSVLGVRRPTVGRRPPPPGRGMKVTECIWSLTLRIPWIGPLDCIPV